MIWTVLGAPIDIDRDQARELAQRELAHPVYREAEPSWWERASTWVWDQVHDLLDRASSALSGAGWLLLLAVVVIAVAVLLAWRAGAVDRRHRASAATVFDVHIRTASEHRARALEAASGGDWRTAVVERFRAVVRALEERGTIDPGPSRTADEVARDAGRRMPEVGPLLLDAAGTFDEVAYGDRGATPEAFEVVARADEQVRHRIQVAPR